MFRLPTLLGAPLRNGQAGELSILQERQDSKGGGGEAIQQRARQVLPRTQALIDSENSVEGVEMGHIRGVKTDTNEKGESHESRFCSSDERGNGECGL